MITNKPFTIIEKAFILKDTSPFNVLEDQELLNIADTCLTLRYSEGDAVIPESGMLNYLLILADGVFVHHPEQPSVIENIKEGVPTPKKLIGVNTFLNDIPIQNRLYAGPNGISCLGITKGYFFTAIYECPNLLVELMKLHKLKLEHFS
ncbi:MAG: hypothetical protein LAT67_00415 [Balneolales bacterium]|nr:hypothetical protein [Balneolales bacterium]